MTMQIRDDDILTKSLVEVPQVLYTNSYFVGLALLRSSHA